MRPPCALWPGSVSRQGPGHSWPIPQRQFSLEIYGREGGSRIRFPCRDP